MIRPNMRVRDRTSKERALVTTGQLEVLRPRIFKKHKMFQFNIAGGRLALAI
jgi:hypothetical protein